MWKRSEIKQRAKFTFKRNYWKCVLISLLFALFVGGGTGGSFASAGGNGVDEESRVTLHQDTDDDTDLYLDLSEDADYQKIKESVETEMGKTAMAAFAVTVVIVFLIIFFIVLAIAIVLDAFLFNPLEVGCDRFYLRNLNEPGQISSIGYAFDNNYKNIVKTMFFRDLFTFLWSLLLIIPGIVKSYEYQMIPYLLADNPQMTKEQAFAESRRMMSGQKWRAFVLDLSFLGWNILSLLTFGILGIFYVQPYRDATHAALYEALRYGTPAAQQIEGAVY